MLSVMRTASSNPYTAEALALIARHRQGRVLDCGAGLRKQLHPQVVCCDVTMHEGLKLLARGEALPFADHSFDAVLSLAVLEHTPDPVAHAAELVRVLKPGGEILVDAAFLQPWHGFPSHWYAFTRCGLERCFAELESVECRVGPHQQPWVSLRWILERFAAGIVDPDAREAFLARPVGELLEAWRPLAPPDEALLLDEAATEELAAGFSLRGRKGAGPPSLPSPSPWDLHHRLLELQIENRELAARNEILTRRKGPGAWLRSALRWIRSGGTRAR